MEIYDHQINSGKLIIEAFKQGKNLSYLQSPTQVGKTGCASYVCENLMKEGFVRKENVFILTNLASVDWKFQMKERFSIVLEQSIYKRQDLMSFKKKYKLVSSQENKLIIIDEPQYGAGRCQSIGLMLMDLGLTTAKSIIKNKVFILQISATHDDALSEITSCHENTENIIFVANMEIPSEYVGFDKLNIRDYSELDDILKSQL
jgi:hypothetical protein